MYQYCTAAVTDVGEQYAPLYENPNEILGSSGAFKRGLVCQNKPLDPLLHDGDKKIFKSIKSKGAQIFPVHI